MNWHWSITSTQCHCIFICMCFRGSEGFYFFIPLYNTLNVDGYHIAMLHATNSLQCAHYLLWQTCGDLVVVIHHFAKIQNKALRPTVKIYVRIWINWLLQKLLLHDSRVESGIYWTFPLGLITLISKTEMVRTRGSTRCIQHNRIIHISRKTIKAEHELCWPLSTSQNRNLQYHSDADLVTFVLVRTLWLLSNRGKFYKNVMTSNYKQRIWTLCFT